MGEDTTEDDLDGEPQNRGNQALLMLGFWNTSLSGGHFLTQHEPLCSIPPSLKLLEVKGSTQKFLNPKPPILG